jgi:Domain of unknown function (DUF4124)
MNKLIILVASFLLAGAAAAQQYKWVDKDGKVRYGDVPPPGVDAQRLRAPPPGTPSAPAAAAKKDAAKPLTPEQAFRKRQEDAAKASETQAKAEQEAQLKRQNCEQAQTAVRTLESGQRISRTDSKGERYFLDESQTAQELQRARQTASQWCGG